MLVTRRYSSRPLNFAANSPGIASDCWASKWPRPPAPSIAQVRCGQAAAHASSRSACDADARTRSSPSGSSAGLITTAVCEPLVRVHPDHHCRHDQPLFWTQVTVAGMPYFRT